MAEIETKWIGSKLSRLGYKLTPQRLMVLKCVEDAENHVSAEEIYSQVSLRYPQMNSSTVYRTLELAKKLGLVTETDLGDGRARYQCMGKGRSHHHLVCEKCGKIIFMDESDLSSLWSAIQQKYNFEVDMKHLAFFGVCPDCQSKSQP